MPDVAILPTARARAGAASINPRNAGTCGIYDIAGRLGQAHRQPAWLCRYLDTLIDRADFPAPFPLARGGKLVRSVHGDSRWPHAAIEAWFDNQLPPEARAVVDRVERAEIDSRLSARAARLFADGAA